LGNASDRVVDHEVRDEHWPRLEVDELRHIDIAGLRSNAVNVHSMERIDLEFHLPAAIDHDRAWNQQILRLRRMIVAYR
jgi:hypothetical protein